MTEERVPSLSQLRRRKRAGKTTPSLFDRVDLEEFGTAVPVLLPSTPTELVSEFKIWSVVELMSRIRGLVERSYAAVTVEGEVSNWRPSNSGHCYFTLKDGQAQLAVVMFRAQAQRLRFVPRDGLSVRVTGSLSVYESRGQMQLVVERMEEVGMGALLAATRELKERLRAEGLFDRKRPLPAFPRCVGVVTSLQGAALRDIVKVCRRRHASVWLLVYPVAVQGEACAAEVVEALEWFSRNVLRADAVIVARGGGSWEDLHGFDDERVVRAIAACTIPVVAGIGHATDSTLADAVADACAPTPSAAAELVTEAHHRIAEQVETMNLRMLRAARYGTFRFRQAWIQLGADGAFRRARERFYLRVQLSDELNTRLREAILQICYARREPLASLQARLLRSSPRAAVQERRAQRRMHADRLHDLLRASMRERVWEWKRLNAQVAALSPLSILGRGYAVVQTADGSVLRDASQIGHGDVIVARLARGRLRATVDDTEIGAASE